MKIVSVAILTLFFIAFLAGVCAGKYIHSDSFVLQKEINPMHALSIFCTLFVAVFIAVLVDRHKSRDKSEKELFLNRINCITIIADSLHERLSEQTIQLIDATSRLKRIRSSIRCVYQALTTVKKRVPTEEESLQAIIKDLNTLMTLTPPKSENGDTKPPIQISKGLCKYSLPRSVEIESQIEALKNTLFRIQVDINNCYPLA